MYSLTYFKEMNDLIAGIQRQIDTMNTFAIQDETLIIPVERMERALLVVKQRTRRHFNKSQFDEEHIGSIIWNF